MGFQSLGLSVRGDQILGFRIQGVRLRIWHLDSKISGLEHRVDGLGVGF